jgi:cellulose synthase/poly-beta-1,6-N-acetylglucosamine synthase-like glycosyltransferase
MMTIYLHNPLTISLLIVFFLLLLYYLVIFIRLAFYKKTVNKKYPPVSIVIVAKEEGFNLKNHLPLICEQRYPNQFEVLVVDDNSTDNSEDIICELKYKYSNLNYLRLDNKMFEIYKGKKFPLSIGIKNTKFDYLLLTDADCKPASDLWLMTMMEAYSDKTEIVLGYGKYEKTKGFLNTLIRWDTFFHSVMYFSAAIWGFPYMGVGRNLSYKKELFFRVKGFTNHMNLMTGDDDLFIKDAANKDNVSICIDHKAHTISKAPKSLNKYFIQKKRHFKSSSYYKIVPQIYLTLIHCLQIAFRV